MNAFLKSVLTGIVLSFVSGCEPDGGIEIDVDANGIVCSGPCIVADASQQKHVISPHLFGDQINWGSSGTWLMDRDTSATCNASLDGAAPRPAILSPLTQLGVTLLRYPGGSDSDFFHWAGAVGPISSRTPQINPWSSTWTSQVRECPVFGPDEAASVATSLGAGLLVTANVGTGTAQEAASWLSYEKARGTTVKYWEIGNENYLPGDAFGNPYVFGAAHKTAPEYAAIYDAYAAALRGVDPAIKLIAIGNEDTGAGGWNQVVLQSTTQKIDHLAVHFGYAPAWCTDPNATMQRQFTALMAAPLVVSFNLQRVEAQIAQLRPPPNGTSGITLAFGEHAALFDFCPSDTMDQVLEKIRRNKTLGSALYTALDFNLLFSDKNVALASHINLSSPHYQAAINTSLADGYSSPVKSALYPVFRLYAQSGGGRFVPATVSNSPTFSTEGYGITPPVSGVPSLDSAAVRSGTKFYIYVVNRDLSQAITARVVANGLGTVTSVISEEVNGPTYDAVNTPAAPNTVKLTTRTLAASKDFTYTFPAHSLTRIRLQ